MLMNTVDKPSPLPSMPSPIPLRTLGAHGPMVSALGLGLAALGRPGYITLDHGRDLGHNYDIAAMQHHAHALLDLAWAQGICYFDAARSYGRAEEFLGSWLRSRHVAHDAIHAPPIVGSKWGYTYTANWQVDAPQHEVKAHTLPVLQRQWQESHSNLGSSLRLYQIHSATFDSGVLQRVEVLRELARHKADGLLIGLSLSGAKQAAVLAAALEVEVDGVRLFDSVQATWNLLEPTCGSMLHTAHNAGWGVIVKEAVANGRLTARNQEPEFAPKLALLQRMADLHGTSVDGVALAAALAQPWATVVLSGAATAAQLHSNLGALAVNLTDGDWQELQALAEMPANYWAARGRLAWN